MVALANADYETRKTEREPCSIRSIEREWRLKAGQLRYYRANRKRRADSGVRILSRRK